MLLVISYQQRTSCSFGFITLLFRICNPKAPGKGSVIRHGPENKKISTYGSEDFSYYDQQTNYLFFHLFYFFHHFISRF